MASDFERRPLSFWEVVKKDAAANGISFGGVRLLIAITMSPGTSVLFLFRLSEWSRRIPLIGQLMSKILWRMSVRTGCQISLGASLAPGICLPHPTGVVIGSGAVVESSVTIYQGVTLGLNGKSQQYPRLENRVVVYAGAVVLGDVTVGEGAVVGANSVVLTDIPPGAVAVGAPARVVRSGGIVGESAVSRGA